MKTSEMTNHAIADELASLPAEARREVVDFIVFSGNGTVGREAGLLINRLLFKVTRFWGYGWIAPT